MKKITLKIKMKMSSFTFCVFDVWASDDLFEFVLETIMTIFRLFIGRDNYNHLHLAGIGELLNFIETTKWS